MLIGRNSLFVMMVVVLLSAGCGNMVKVGVKSDNDLNIVGSGNALPVVVRVYQLSDDVGFKNAAFRDLWKKDAEALGPALLSVKEVTLQPESKEKITFALDPKTKFVAGFAIFRNPHAAKWKFIEPVSDGFFAGYWHNFFSVGISLRLSKNTIELDN